MWGRLSYTQNMVQVEVIGLENITFTAAQPTLAGLVRLRALVLHDCIFEHPICSLTTLTVILVAVASLPFILITLNHWCAEGRQ